MSISNITLNANQISPRLCGLTSKTNSIYLTNGLSFSGKNKQPLWNFLQDTTYVLPDGFGLSKTGMELRERVDQNGNLVFNAQGKQVYDLWDWIGEESYPNWTDWFIEAQDLGIHQLVPSTLNFERFTKETRYLAVHRKASVRETQWFYDNPVVMKEYPACPKNIQNHIDGVDVWGTCPRLGFEYLVEGTLDNKDEPRSVTRNLPATSYGGYKVPDGVEINYDPALFLSYPIGQVLTLLVYKDDPEDELSVLKKLEDLEESLKNIKIVTLE